MGRASCSDGGIGSGCSVCYGCALSKAEVGWTAPVKIVTDSEEAVCVGTEVCDAFAVAMILERRVFAPS